MKRVPFLNPMREIPAGYEGSIVRSSVLDNAKWFPLTAAIGRTGRSARRGDCGRCMPIRPEIVANRIRCRCPAFCTCGRGWRSREDFVSFADGNAVTDQAGFTLQRLEPYT
jgi:hypothetical protein